MSKQQSMNYTPAQRAAYNAGMGYGYGKAGERVPVKPENQDSFRKGNEVARTKLGMKNKSATKSHSGYTVSDKCAYYSKRIGDKSLTQRQRDYAAKRLAKLCGR